jgi:hypothetical protein
MRHGALDLAAIGRSVSDFLIETFQVADPSEARGSSVTARELLDSATLRLSFLSFT